MMREPLLGLHPRRFSSPLTYTVDVSTTGPWCSGEEEEGGERRKGGRGGGRDGGMEGGEGEGGGNI